MFAASGWPRMLPKFRQGKVGRPYSVLITPYSRSSLPPPSPLSLTLTLPPPSLPLLRRSATWRPVSLLQRAPARPPSTRTRTPPRGNSAPAPASPTRQQQKRPVHYTHRNSPGASSRTERGNCLSASGYFTAALSMRQLARFWSIARACAPRALQVAAAHRALAAVHALHTRDLTFLEKCARLHGAASARLRDLVCREGTVDGA